MLLTWIKTLKNITPTKIKQLRTDTIYQLINSSTGIITLFLQSILNGYLIYYRYYVITSVQSCRQHRQYLVLKHNYKYFWIMYSASSGTPLNTHHHYYSPVQCLHIGKTCTLHCRNRPKLCSIQVASKLVQTPNLVDISTVIIAIRHNAKLNYLNRNITKDALNFYAESTHENGGVR